MRIGIVLCTLLGAVAMTEAFFPSCRLPGAPLTAYYTATNLPVHPKAKIVKPSPTGTRISFKCIPGYVIKGKTDFRCYDYGWFPFSFPRCIKERSCPWRRAPKYGYVSPRPNTPTRNYKVGTIIEFSCRPGYRLEGKSKDRCGSNLKWEIDDPPKCVLIQCPYRTPPTNGFVNPKKQFYAFNEIITFTCKRPKYVLVGKSKDKCGYDSKWVIHDTPKCKITCDGRDAPKDGSVYPKKDYFFATESVSFKCDKGFRLEGTAEDVCKADGNWKINLTPKCDLITCPQRTAPDNGVILGVVDPYLPKNKIKFQCNEGYRLIGEEYDTCQRDGSWEENKTPICRIIPCRQRKAPGNGKIVNPQNPYLPDYTINFECDSGYRLEGEDEDTCLLGGSWSVDDTPKCVLITCRQRKAPANGRIVETKDPYVPDDIIKFECNKYFNLDGEDSDTCQDDGSWETDDTPKCVQITCPQRMAPENGGIKGAQDPYLPENEITFFCIKYYRLEGRADDVCQGDGSWEENMTPECVQITCPQREAPEFGQLLGGKNPFVPTDMIRFKCDDGYRLEGEEKDRCEENGSWRFGRAPTCVLILCTKYDAPPNGAYKLYPPPGKKPLQPGTKLRFFCLEHYEIEGYPFDKCEEGGVWKSKKRPVCKPIAYSCYYRNPPRYGYIQGKKDTYAVGDKIKFTCKTGYQTVIKEDVCKIPGVWMYADDEKNPRFPECVAVKY